MMPSIMSGSLIRETPPWARMSAGTRSRAITATAPASSAIFACSAVTTSMMTPPLSISAMPRLTRAVPTECSARQGRVRGVGRSCSDMPPILRAAGGARSPAGQAAATVACARRGSAERRRPFATSTTQVLPGPSGDRLAGRRRSVVPELDASAATRCR